MAFLRLGVRIASLGGKATEKEIKILKVGGKRIELTHRNASWSWADRACQTLLPTLRLSLNTVGSVVQRQHSESVMFGKIRTRKALENRYRSGRYGTIRG